MKILLLNHMPIVESLVQKLVEQRGDELLLLPSEDRADVVIVDSSFVKEDVAMVPQQFGEYVIALAEKDADSYGEYDKTITKPFLPRELSLVLDLASIKVSKMDSRVLNMGEIDSVKELLDGLDDGVETLPAEEIEQKQEDDVQLQESVEFNNIDLNKRATEALEDISAIITDPSVMEAFRRVGVGVNITFGKQL